MKFDQNLSNTRMENKNIIGKAYKDNVVKRHHLYMSTYDKYHKRKTPVFLHFFGLVFMQYELTLLNKAGVISNPELDTLLKLFKSQDKDNRYIAVKLIKTKSKVLEKEYRKNINFKKQLDLIVINYYKQIIQPTNNRLIETAMNFLKI